MAASGGSPAKVYPFDERVWGETQQQMLEDYTLFRRMYPEAPTPRDIAKGIREGPDEVVRESTFGGAVGGFLATMRAESARSSRTRGEEVTNVNQPPRFGSDGHATEVAKEHYAQETYERLRGSIKFPDAWWARSVRERVNSTHVGFQIRRKKHFLVQYGKKRKVGMSNEEVDVRHLSKREVDELGLGGGITAESVQADEDGGSVNGGGGGLQPAPEDDLPPDQAAEEALRRIIRYEDRPPTPPSPRIGAQLTEYNSHEMLEALEAAAVKERNSRRKAVATMSTAHLVEHNRYISGVEHNVLEEFRKREKKLREENALRKYEEETATGPRPVLDAVRQQLKSAFTGMSLGVGLFKSETEALIAKNAKELNKAATKQKKQRKRDKIEEVDPKHRKRRSLFDVDDLIEACENGNSLKVKTCLLVGVDPNIEIQGVSLLTHVCGKVISLEKKRAMRRARSRRTASRRGGRPQTADDPGESWTDGDETDTAEEEEDPNVDPVEAHLRSVNLKEMEGANDPGTTGSFLRIARFLIRHGAYLDTIDGGEGYNSLHLACKHNHQGLTRFLLKKGAGIEVRDIADRTPLMICAAHSSVRSAAILLQNGAQIEAQDNADRTPLHHAAAMGHSRMCTYLLRAGAKRDAKDREGCTPPDVATANNKRITAQTIQGYTDVSLFEGGVYAPVIDFLTEKQTGAPLLESHIDPRDIHSSDSETDSGDSDDSDSDSDSDGDSDDESEYSDGRGSGDDERGDDEVVSELDEDDDISVTNA